MGSAEEEVALGRRGEEIEANLLRLITAAEKARRRLGGVELHAADPSDGARLARARAERDRAWGR